MPIQHPEPWLPAPRGPARQQVPLQEPQHEDVEGVHPDPAQRGLLLPARLYELSVSAVPHQADEDGQTASG